MRSPCRSVALVLLFTLLAAGSAAAQDWDQYHFRTTPLADAVFLLQGAGGNMLAVTGPRGVLLVDSDYEPMAERAVLAVDSLQAGPARAVINTHWHFDHVGANVLFAEAGAMIVAHANSREYMSQDRHLDVLDEEVGASPEAALPTLLVEDSLTLWWGELEIQLRHAPAAHTGGDLVVRIPAANLVHAGDLFFNLGYPYVDTAHGGHIDGMIRGLRSILEECDEETRIVPGHGPLATPADLRQYVEMLQAFRDAVAPLVLEGRTLAEILEAKPTAELDAEYGDKIFPPPAFTEMVYLSLKQE